MIKSLWIAKTGLEANQAALDVISNNLANSNTAGFKRSRAVFEDLMYQNEKVAGASTGGSNVAPTGVQIGTGVRQVANVRNHTQGALTSTGNPLDVAIQGSGFFKVELPDGSNGYTRDGSLQVNAEGLLVTSNGNKLVPNIQIPQGANNISISQDGQVTATIGNTTVPTAIGNITLTEFINPAGLTSIGSNTLVESAASGAPQDVTPGSDGSGTLGQGFVESSNVNVVEELVSMIQSQRAYEINSKAIQAADQMLQKISQI